MLQLSEVRTVTPAFCVVWGEDTSTGIILKKQRETKLSGAAIEHW